MKNPQCSIILPTFNRSAYLSQAIESCLRQSLGELELIIIDDASTDDTSSVLRRHMKNDRRIKLITHKTNRGQIRSMNEGFRMASGEFLTWTSDDNLYEPEALHCMVETLGKTPEVDLVYCDMKLIDQDGNFTRDWTAAETKHEVHSGRTLGGCFLYRRKVYERLGDYDENLPISADWIYWIRAYQNFNLKKCVGIAPYQYRIHNQSITAKGRIRRLKEELEVRKQFQLSAEPYACFAGTRHGELCKEFWSNKKYWQATKHFLLQHYYQGQLKKALLESPA